MITWRELMDLYTRLERIRVLRSKEDHTPNSDARAFVETLSMELDRELSKWTTVLTVERLTKDLEKAKAS